MFTKGSFIYDFRKEGGGSQNFGQFCRWLWMALAEGEVFSDPADIFMYKKKICISQ